jgi:hypothetical protein
VITLRPTRLHWLNDAPDDVADLCAHSPVDFRVGEAAFVRAADGDWTVSAAGLYLLRTLTRDHTRATPVGDHLFPCCGFTMMDLRPPAASATTDGGGGADADAVVVFGCPNGIDVAVEHVGGGGEDGSVRLTDAAGRAVTVSKADWRQAVTGFADAVEAFYRAASAKVPPAGDDENGYRAFWEEWHRRRRSA